MYSALASVNSVILNSEDEKKRVFMTFLGCFWRFLAASNLWLLFSAWSCCDCLPSRNKRL